jgi:hypothetical protein
MAYPPIAGSAWAPLSGQKVTQLSHSVHSPHWKQRPASAAPAQVRPPTVSSNCRTPPGGGR